MKRTCNYLYRLWDLQCLKGHNWSKYTQELQFLHCACHLIIVIICIEFHEIFRLHSEHDFILETAIYYVQRNLTPKIHN